MGCDLYFSVCIVKYHKEIIKKITLEKIKMTEMIKVLISFHTKNIERFNLMLKNTAQTKILRLNSAHIKCSGLTDS